jgi:hypothetical protein
MKTRTVGMILTFLMNRRGRNFGSDDGNGSGNGSSSGTDAD